jgi:abortive infection bacteriophage resistance protein
VPELIQHLKNRGLRIKDDAAAVRSLSLFGYHRLCPYFRDLQTSAGQFVPGADMENVVKIYEADRALRLLCLAAIQRIEVALRAAIVNEVAVPEGPHFYLEQKHFDKFLGFINFLTAAHWAFDQGKSPSIKWYKNNYHTPEMPPIWVILDIIEFGKLSFLFADLTVQHRNAVAGVFGLDESVLVSWFRCLSVLRNQCAHHERIWNTQAPVQPKQEKFRFRNLMNNTASFCSRIVVVSALMESLSYSDEWFPQLTKWLQERNEDQLTQMGFPTRRSGRDAIRDGANWLDDKLWA